MPDTVMGWAHTNADRLTPIEVRLSAQETEIQTLRQQIEALTQLVSATQAAVLQVQNRIG